MQDLQGKVIAIIGVDGSYCAQAIQSGA